MNIKEFFPKIFLLLIAVLFLFSLSACGGGSDSPSTVNVQVRATADNTSTAPVVVISVDENETVYENQSTLSTIDLGEIKTGTQVQASVTSIDGTARVSILVDDCFRDSDSCDQVGCTATAKYIVEQEECINY